MQIKKGFKKISTKSTENKKNRKYFYSAKDLALIDTLNILIQKIYL